ncbi:MAG: TetR/AcrR family transcriptional regulator, partial [Lachnospiraceae bacterium]
MKREEKVQCSKERIIDAAMEEFGANSYDMASLNNICNDNAISKGLVYHYYGNKDDLYLSCVKVCFEKFTNFLAEESYHFSDIQCGMNQYFARRFLFFHNYPREGGLFFYTVLQPPKHLVQQLQELRKDFDAQCIFYYKEALKHITLREGIAEQEALEYFTVFQEVFHEYFQRNKETGADVSILMKAHEAQLSKTLNMMLYGIAKE